MITVIIETNKVAILIRRDADTESLSICEGLTIIIRTKSDRNALFFSPRLATENVMMCGTKECRDDGTQPLRNGDVPFLTKPIDVGVVVALEGLLRKAIDKVEQDCTNLVSDNR